MTDNAKKKQFIKTLVKYSFDQSISKDLKKELCSLLKKDTPELKLYKYRSFDSKGYSIENLQEQTLHCSKRSTFNDPFDCRVGLDFESFASAFIDIDTERITTLFRKFVEITVHKAKFSDLSPEDEAVIERWNHSESLKLFCQRCKSPNLTIKKLNQTFIKQPRVIYDLMHGAMADGKYKDAFEKKREDFEKQIAQLISSSDKCVPSKNVYELEAKKRKLNLDVDQIDLVSSLSQENEPEVSKKIQDIFASLDGKMKELFDNMVLVGSLCTDYINPLMWAHYADSHKGFCVEYDFSDSDEEILLPFPVIYSKKMVGMPWKCCAHSDGTKSPEFSGRLIQAILTKHDVWQYEKEWRILLPSNAEANHKMPKISCVYVGAFCSQENEQKILEIAKDRFTVKKMTVDRGKFAFHSKILYEP